VDAAARREAPRRPGTPCWCVPDGRQDEAAAMDRGSAATDPGLTPGARADGHMIEIAAATGRRARDQLKRRWRPIAHAGRREQNLGRGALPPAGRHRR